MAMCYLSCYKQSLVKYGSQFHVRTSKSLFILAWQGRYSITEDVKIYGSYIKTFTLSTARPAQELHFVTSVMKGHTL